jgi:hypothetical protein
MKKKKINNSDRLSVIEQYLYGFDLDGKRLSAPPNQNGMSLRAIRYRIWFTWSRIY